MDISNLHFSTMCISFSDGKSNIVVSASGDSDFVDLGDLRPNSTGPNVTACLRWKKGRKLVLSGRLQSEVGNEIQVIDHVVLQVCLLMPDVVSECHTQTRRGRLAFPTEFCASRSRGLGDAQRHFSTRNRSAFFSPVRLPCSPMIWDRA